MRRHRDLAVDGVDLVALKRRDPLFGRIVDRDHDVGISEQGQLHGLLQKTAFPFVEAHLMRGKYK